MYPFDHKLNLVDWLGVIADANQIRIFESLVGNTLRKRMFVIQRNFELCYPVVLPPGIFPAVFVISWPD